MNKTKNTNRLTQSQNNKFRREITRENYNRMVYLSIIVFVLEFIIVLLPTRLFNYDKIIIYFLISNIILIPLIIFIKNKFDKININVAYIVQYAYIVSLMYLGIALALKAQTKADFVHMYLMAVVGVASFFHLGFIQRTVIILSGQAAFSALIPFYQPDTAAVFVLIANTIFFNIIAWLISYMRFKSEYRTFCDNLELKKLAHRDSMTGLYNHETILNKLIKEVEQTKILKTELSIVMIDVDNFKEINDSYGHMIGDTLLKQLSEIIIEITEENHYIGRYGGDEFLLVLPGCDLKKAETLTNKLFDKIKLLNTKVTLSAGISQLKNESFKDFIKRADKNLYIAKKSGKNRTEVCN
ncbi:MAG: GGDEF domain-containing protein [Bacillota bacterium]